MKKKVFLGLLAGGMMMTACTEHDAVQEGRVADGLTFAPTVAAGDWNGTSGAGQDATRGVLFTATSFGGSDVFGVSAYRYDGTELTPSTATANFLYKAPVRQVLEKWRTSESYYWPGADDKLDFYAYYPYNHANVTVRERETTGPMQIVYTVNTDPTQQVDFMTATAKNQTFNTEADVPLSFRHELTAVRLVLDENVAPGYLKSITFNHVATQGTLTLGGEWTGLNDGTFNLNLTSYYDATNGFKTTGDDNFIAVGSELTERSTTLLMIPQTFTAENQKMTAVFVNDQHPDGIELTTRLTQPWEAGQTITYRISTTDINVLRIASVNYPGTDTWGNAWIRSAYASGSTVGIYAIDAEGTVKVDNTRLTLNASGAWVTDEGTTQLFTPGLKWFMYSPYKTGGLSHSAKKDGVVVTTADDFFADGIAAWSPNAKQDTEADLLAQDLQVGTGVETSASAIRFDMAHTMGVVHLSIPASTEVPNLVYFDGNEGTNSTTRVSVSSETTTVAPSRSFTTNKPYDKGDNLFLFIARPGDVTLAATTTAAESYNAWDNSITATVSANAYTTKNVTNKCITRNYIKRGWVYEYSGSAKTFTTPAAGSYIMECWGAQGGGSITNSTSRKNSWGMGGYTKGTVSLASSTSLFVFVGQRGADAVLKGNTDRAWNGGGLGSYDNGDDESAGAGGGATDIRTVKCSADNKWNEFASLKSRIMVAAGGGGLAWYPSLIVASTYGAYPGYGGGLAGGDATTYESSTIRAIGATQTSGYAFGYGGDTTSKTETSVGIGGGGGGYYGGNIYTTSADTHNHSSGAGGSSFISGHTGCDAIDASSEEGSITHTGSPNHYSDLVFSDTQMIAGNATQTKPDGGTETGHSGNGYARITENFIE